MTISIQIRRATTEDVIEIMAVHCAAVHGTASAFYDPIIINDWSPNPTPPERIKDLTARITSDEEIMLIVENSSGQIVGFGQLFHQDQS